MNKLHRHVLVKCLTFLSIFVFLLPSFAINGRTTYQAKIVKPDGHPLEASNVNFRFSVLDQTGSCVLYVEDYSAINMTDTGGLISFPLGSGTRAFPTSGTSQTFQNTFDNSIASFACQSVGIYNPNPTDTRKIVMQFNDGAGWQTLPAMSLNAVPYAMFATRANNSLTLNNKADTAFVEYSSIPTCTASQALQYTGSSFVCVTAGGGGSVTSSTVTTALGYSPVAPASVTALTSSLASTDATVASVSSSVYSVSSTVSGLSSTVTSLSNSVAASFAAMTSSQWTSSGTSIYYNSGNVGIGASSPIGKLHLADNIATLMVLEGSINGTAAPGYVARKSRGTITSPTAVLNEDYLGTFGGRGYGTTGYSATTKGLIGIKASENWTDTAQGASIVFETTPISSTTRTERVRIDASGYVGIGVSNPVTRLEVSGGVRIGTEAATCSASYAGTLRYNAGNVEYCNGTLWAPFGVAGAGITSLNSSTSGTQTFATGTTGTVFNISSVNGVHTFNIPLASVATVTAGLLSNADYLVFTNKLSATSAAVISALGYTPLDKASNLSDLSNAATARSNLGLGSLATANSVDLGSASATGTISAARLPAFSGDASSVSGSNILTLTSVGAGVVSGSQYTKVTVDGKGRVTSGAQLSSGDVSTALGYAPASSSIYLGGSSAATFSDIELNTKLGYSASTTNLYTQYQAYRPDGYNSNITEITGQHVSSLVFNTYDHTGYGNNGVFFSKIPFGGNFKASGTITMAIKNNSTVGIGVVTPQARLHLASGTSSIAPLKFSSSTLVTSPQSGTMEYDGINFYLTDGINQRRVIALGSSSGTVDNASTINSTSNMTLNPAAGTGSVIVSSTTNSTSTNTGALVVNGGAGVAGNLNVGGVISGASQVKATGYRASQGAPNSADSSTVGYAFGADGDTGLFSPGAGAANGVLAFYNNDVETMRIVSASLGIGLATPLKTLHVASGSMVGTTAGFPAAYSTVHNEFNSGFLKKWTETSGNEVNLGTYSLVAPNASSTKSNHSLVNILFTDVPVGTSATGTNNAFYNFAVRNRYTGNTDRGYVNSIVGIRNEYGHQNDVPGNNPTTGQIFGAIFSPQVMGGTVGSLYDIYLSSLAGGGSVGQHYSIYQESVAAKNYFGGSVGIGTTSPQKLVQISGLGANGLLLDNGTTDSTNLIFHDSSQVVSGVTWNVDSTNGSFRIFTEPITAVSPLTTVAGIERLIINPNGNIGVGTTTPVDKLHVMGVVTATSGTGNLSMIPDYLGSAYIQSYQGVGVFRPLKIDGLGMSFDAKGSNFSFTSGNVGIGVASPTSKLTVYGTRQSTITPSNALMQVGGNDVFLYAGAGNGIGNPYTIMLQAMRDSDSANFPMALNPNGGNVGIGTLAPEGSLHIVTSGTQTNSPSTGIFLGKSLANDYEIQLTQTGGTPHIDFSRGINTDYDGRISSSANGSLWLGTTSSSALLALNGLNVGIGTTAPTNKFEVRGGDTFMEGRAYVYSNSGWGAITPSISLAIGDNDTGLNWVSDGVLQIYSNNQPRMHFAVTGATGIGRTDPTYSLDVAGTFRVTGQAYTDTGAATFTVLSDIRYKDVHGAYERGLDDLLKIGTIRYNYKKENPTGADSTHEYVGVAAQNVQEAIPEAVEKQTAKNGKEFLTVNPSPIIFAMINGFRDLYNKIVKLIDTDARHDREIASLKAENEELKTKVKEFDELKEYICKKDPQAPNCK